MENKRFINVQDVVEELGVSTSYAYKLIRELNAERAADGFLTIKGRCLLYTSPSPRDRG